ncbi:hypothetical protein C8R45DRAFT_947937 [Mycena sanguinolenta]|nr:hypothetical protein C8R45DRAFT_947937 [Mycena sanguinolenta]
MPSGLSRRRPERRFSGVHRAHTSFVIAGAAVVCAFAVVVARCAHSTPVALIRPPPSLPSLPVVGPQTLRSTPSPRFAQYRLCTGAAPRLVVVGRDAPASRCAVLELAASTTRPKDGDAAAGERSSATTDRINAASLLSALFRPIDGARATDDLRLRPRLDRPRPVGSSSASSDSLYPLFAVVPHLPYTVATVIVTTPTAGRWPAGFTHRPWFPHPAFRAAPSASSQQHSRTAAWQQLAHLVIVGALAGGAKRSGSWDDGKIKSTEQCWAASSGAALARCACGLGRDSHCYTPGLCLRSDESKTRSKFYRRVVPCVSSSGAAELLSTTCFASAHTLKRLLLRLSTVILQNAQQEWISLPDIEGLGATARWLDFVARIEPVAGDTSVDTYQLGVGTDRNDEAFAATIHGSVAYMKMRPPKRDLQRPTVDVAHQLAQHQPQRSTRSLRRFGAPSPGQIRALGGSGAAMGGGAYANADVGNESRRRGRLDLMLLTRRTRGKRHTPHWSSRPTVQPSEEEEGGDLHLAWGREDGYGLQARDVEMADTGAGARAGGGDSPYLRIAVLAVEGGVVQYRV